MLRSILIRVLKNKRYWILLLAMAGIMAFSEMEKLIDIISEGANYSVLDLVADLIIFDRSRAVIAGAMGAISGIGFCEMRENGYDQYCIMRSSPAKYAYMWLTANIVLTLIASYLTFTILFCLLGLVAPAAGAFQGYSVFGPYSGWVQSMPFCYISIIALTSGLSFSVLSLIGIIVVSMFPSRYIAVGIPVIAVEFLYGLGEFFPSHFDFFRVSTALTLFENQGAVFHLVYTVLYFCVWYAVLSLIFMRQVDDRHGKL